MLCVNAHAKSSCESSGLRGRECVYPALEQIGSEKKVPCISFATKVARNYFFYVKKTMHSQESGHIDLEKETNQHRKTAGRARIEVCEILGSERGRYYIRKKKNKKKATIVRISEEKKMISDATPRHPQSQVKYPPDTCTVVCKKSIYSRVIG